MLFNLMMVFVFAVALLHCPTISAQPQGSLYRGEEILTGGGFPALTKFEKGSDPTKPTIVFIPGAAHLGRIAYGCSSCDIRDFPAYWLKRRGYSFLAISYPLAHPVYENRYPGFTVQDWGRQAAEVTKTIIMRHRLNNHVVLVGWSMGGKIAAVFNEAAYKLGIKVDFFIALAATPPLPNFVPGLTQTIKRTTEGLASLEARYPWFISSLKAQNALNKKVIIPVNIYSQQVLGAFPVNLLGTELRYHNGEFVVSTLEAANDARSFEYARFPLIAVITNDSALDARHALTDQSAWGMYTVQKVYQDHLIASGVDPVTLGWRKWQCVRKIVIALPTKLTKFEQGTHLFFVGLKGARVFATDVDALTAEVQVMKRRIDQCVGRSIW